MSRRVEMDPSFLVRRLCDWYLIQYLPYVSGIAMRTLYAMQSPALSRAHVVVLYTILTPRG